MTPPEKMPTDQLFNRLEANLKRLGLTINIAPPDGMTGLAVRLPGCCPCDLNSFVFESPICAVAADWSQASSPVLVYNKEEDGWTDCGRSVLNFSHNAKDALEYIIRKAMIDHGLDSDDDFVKDALDNAQPMPL